MSLQNKKVLFILPHNDFRDKEYLWLKERFDTAEMASEIASSHLSEAQGQFGTILTPDVLVSHISPDVMMHLFLSVKMLPKNIIRIQRLQN